MAFAVSIELAGTQLDAVNQIRIGAFAASAIIQRIPGMPQTFAISCGSATNPVVPCGTTSSAHADGGNIVLSI